MWRMRAIHLHYLRLELLLEHVCRGKGGSIRSLVKYSARISVWMISFTMGHQVSGHDCRVGCAIWHTE